MSKKNSPAACPCGSGTPYAGCCQPWHDGLPAPTAEQLMRARYAAYVLERAAYLLSSWAPASRPASIDFGSPKPKWLGLTVLRTQSESDQATVEFVARYREGGRAQKMHEISRFIRADGRWFYLDGQFPDHTAP